MGSLDEWKAGSALHRQIFDPDYIDQIARSGKFYGFSSKYFEASFQPHEISLAGSNYRDDLRARGLSSRERAILDLLAEENGAKDVSKYRIYAPEALSKFAMTLRSRFPRFVGSEYGERAETRESLFPIPVENLMGLSFPNGAFDCVIVNDVFQHVPDLFRGLQETVRVLKRGGVLLATFPFSYDDAGPTIKASFTDGVIRHFAETEYRHNPVEPEVDSLVFQIPGWSILQDCRAAGFAQAEMLFISSPRRGIIGSEIAGVHVLRCRK